MDQVSRLGTGAGICMYGICGQASEARGVGRASAYVQDKGGRRKQSSREEETHGKGRFQKGQRALKAKRMGHCDIGGRDGMQN